MRNYSTQFSHVIPLQNVTPYLYRYEDKKYIDDFFKNGNLYLSSFMNYKKYDDNELGDNSEGHGMKVFKGENNKDMGTFSIVGKNAFCFCTSTILDEKLKTAFKRNDVFRITDPINFILEINRSLSRVQEVLFGNCIYVDERILYKKVPKVDLENFKDDKEPDKINIGKIMNASELINSIDLFFLKKLIHQHQCEYRILWLTDKIIDKGFVLNCIEATKYCERI